LVDQFTIADQRRRSELRDREARTRAILEMAVDGIVTIDELGAIETFNPAAERIFGYAADEVIGRNVKVLMPAPYHGQHDAYLSAYMRTGIPKIIGIGREVEGKRKDGSTFPLELSVSEMEVAGKRMFTGIVRDVTERVRVEAELRDREARTRAILEMAVDGIVTIDELGAIETFNPAAERIFGYAADEVVGQNVKVLMPGPYHDQHDGYLSAYMRTGVAKIIGIGREVEGKRKDGSTFPLELSVSEMEVAGKRMFTGIVRDVTERAEAVLSIKESENRFKDFAETASDWFWEAGADGRVTYLSENFETKTGYSTQDWIGRLRIDYCPAGLEEDQARSNFLADIQAQKPFRDYMYRYTHANGAEAWVKVNGRPIFDNQGQFKGYRGSSEDVTERVAMENAMSEAMKSAQAANMAKSEFLSAMSHELRTPLNGILGFAQLLSSDRLHPLVRDHCLMVEQIFKAGDHLQNLVEQVLDLSRIEQGQFTVSIEEVEPASVVEECFHLLEAQACDKGLNLEFPLGGDVEFPVVQADRVRLKQVLLNLALNGIKYNTSGSRVQLWAEERDGFLRFVICDDGPGIASEKQPGLFQPFNRLGFEAREIQGTGIGLSISKALVELMGGTIGFEDTPGTGATFWFEVPISTSAPRGLPVGRDVRTLESNFELLKTKPGEASHRVLYIEDNPANMLLMAKIITRLENVEILQAHSAELGIELAKASGPDLILMDINLPGMDGLAALRRLRSIDATASIPVIAISAAAMPTDIRRALDAGFDDYLTKPIKVSKVLHVVEKALERPLADGA
jgi:PAS domain S-box-containing protein